MQRRTVLLGLAGAAIAALPAARAQGNRSGTYRALSWPDLLPPGEAELLVKQKTFLMSRGAAHGSLDDQTTDMASIQPGTFNTVKALDRTRVSLKGFVVPLDFEAGRVSEFLLVPYHGACIHAPPPPPNQTVYVRSDKPVRIPNLSDAMEVSGELRTLTNSTELAGSAYQLALHRIHKLAD